VTFLTFYKKSRILDFLSRILDFQSRILDFFVHDPGQKWPYFLIKPTSYEPIINIINNIINNIITNRAGFSGSTKENKEEQGKTREAGKTRKNKERKLGK
jgi:hypothetical protein